MRNRHALSRSQERDPCVMAAARRRVSTLTVIVLVDDRHLGPIEELHDVLISGVEQTLCGIEINAKLFRLRVQVRPGLEMRDVEGVADAVYVLPQNRIRGPENRLDAVFDLLARYGQTDDASMHEQVSGEF